MNLQEIVDKTFERLKIFKVEGLMPALHGIKPPFDGALEDILNINGCANYQWSACLMDVLKPFQVIELGGAMGAWCLCVLHTLPEDSQLYSITLAEGGREFVFMVDKYPNFHPIVGDDLDLKNWEGVDLTQTDIWYFDSLHTNAQLTKELELYTPFFKKGAILLFDDIRMDELWPVWDKLVKDKNHESRELTDPCHWSGWGIVRW